MFSEVFYNSISILRYESESKILIHSSSKGIQMKSLRPSNKENKRYLLIHGKDLKENIEKAILEFSGISGMRKCGLSFISSDSKNNSAVICINRESVDLVRASLAVFPEKMEVLKVSGTLKGLNKK